MRELVVVLLLRLAVSLLGNKRRKNSAGAIERVAETLIIMNDGENAHKKEPHGLSLACACIFFFFGV